MRSPNLTLLVAALVLASTPASAVILNGGFESPPAGEWGFDGDVGRAGGAILGYAPTEGTFQAFLTTIDTASDPFAPFSGVDASDAATIEAALSMNVGTIQSAGGAPGLEGTGIWQSFTTVTDSVLSIDWNLFSTEPTGVPTNDDFVFIAIRGTGGYEMFFSPGSVNTTALAPTPSPAILASGWNTSSFGLPAGDYEVMIGVFDVGDVVGASALAVDDVRLTPNPEPDTGVLVAFGLVFLSLRRRRLRSERALHR